MIVEEFYNELKEVLNSCFNDPSWEKITLNIEIQPGVLGSLGGFVKDGIETPMRIRLDSLTKDKLELLHKITTPDGDNKWNKAVFILNSNEEFSSSFTWDQEYQDKIDAVNKKEMKKDPNYSPPKWHWEE